MHTEGGALRCVLARAARAGGEGAPLCARFVWEYPLSGVNSRPFVNVETSASLLTDDGGADDGGVDGRVGRLNLPVAGPVGATQRSELLRLYTPLPRAEGAAGVEAHPQFATFF